MVKDKDRTQPFIGRTRSLFFNEPALKIKKGKEKKKGIYTVNSSVII